MTNCPNCGAPLTGHKCEYCGAAAIVIENMYYDFGEHIVDTKLLMSPDQAAGILREFAKDFEECGGWDIEDEDLITALKVAIKCLEVNL